MVTRMNQVDLTAQGDLFDEKEANVRRYTLSNALNYLKTRELETAQETIQKAKGTR